MRKINHESNTFPNFISKCINFNYGTFDKLGISMIFILFSFKNINTLINQNSKETLRTF